MRWRCIVIYNGASPVTNTRGISGERSIFFCAESILGNWTTGYFSRARHASLWNNWMTFLMATPEVEVHFIDQHFAALMNRLEKVSSPELELAAKLVSNFRDRKSTRLNSSHRTISYAVFCLKKNNVNRIH